MRLFRFTPIWLLAIACSVTGFAQQSIQQKSAFVLDESRPYVYFELDHVGPTYGNDGELTGPEGVWMRLHNNCTLPISISENGASPGNGDGSIWYEVVRGNAYTPDPLQAKPDYTDMPSGNHPDFGSMNDIMPGKSMLFVFPASAIQEYWSVSVSFDLKTPHNNKSVRVSGSPHQFLTINWYDMPESYRHSHPPRMTPATPKLNSLNPPTF